MQAAIDYLKLLPLEWFVLVGSFFEELISPIPSFVILVPAGAGLSAQGASVWHILILALIAGLGRVLAAVILYWLAGWLYRAIFTRRSRWLGLKRQTIRQFRQKLGPNRAWWALFSMWAIPIFPGAPLSLASGFMKLPLLVFITATFWGSVVNAAFYLYLGYLGLNVASGAQDYATGGQLIGFGVLGILLVWLMKRRARSRNRSTVGL